MSLSSNIVFRNTVATAVHETVTEFTMSDGLGHCDFYALAGTVLLREITGRPYQLQLGSLMYLSDPRGNGWLEIDARNGGLDRMEYHAWIGLAGQTIADNGDKGKFCEVGEFIDFSARHLREMVNRMPQVTDAARIGDNILLTLTPSADRIAWTRPDDPPDYLWEFGQPPQDFRYTPDYQCMSDYYQWLTRHRIVTTKLSHLVMVHYRKAIKDINL